MGARGNQPDSSAQVPGVRSSGGLDGGFQARGWAGGGGRGRELLHPEAPRQDTGTGTLQEQGPSGAPSGCFLRAWVSPKNPQNPTGGVSVWATITLKGFHNHTL